MRSHRGQEEPSSPGDAHQLSRPGGQSDRPGGDDLRIAYLFFSLFLVSRRHTE